MRIAGGKGVICRWMARIFLNFVEQKRHSFFKAPAEEMRNTYHLDGSTNARTRTQAQRGFEMLDRDVGLPGPYPDRTTDVPAACVARVERQRAVDQRDD